MKCLVALLDRCFQNTSCVGGEQWRHGTLGDTERKSEHRAFVEISKITRQQTFIVITSNEYYYTCLLEWMTTADILFLMQREIAFSTMKSF